MSSDNDQTASVQMRYVQAPARVSSSLALLVIGAGILIIGLLSLIAAAYLVEWLGLDHTDQLAITLLYVATVCGSCGGWGVFAHLMQWGKQMERIPGARLRHRRLSLLKRNNRLHRCHPRLEFQAALLTPFRTSGRIWRAVSPLPAGSTMAVGFPLEYQFARPVPNEIGFEPIEMDEPNDQMRALLEMNLAAGGIAYAEKIEPPKVSKLARNSQSRRRKPTPSDLLWLLAAIGFSLWIWQARGTFPFFYFFMMTSGFALSHARSLVDPRRWWLVPGGIVYREARSWRKKMKVGMVTPENSPLFVHYEEGYALVRVNTMTLRIGCPDWTGWCVMAAWMSTAARPTKEEVLAFFGPDAEWEGN